MAGRLKNECRDAQPSAAILDSQSVKSDGHGGLVGYDAAKGFAVLPRRLVRDYERTEISAEAWIRLAMIRAQLRRLA